MRARAGRRRWRSRVTVPEPQVRGQLDGLDLGKAYQGETRTARLTVSNQGASPCEVTVASDAGWVKATPERFGCQPGQSVPVTVEADASRMGLGTHKARLAVVAEAGGWRQETPVAVAVELPWLKTFVRRYRVALIALGVAAIFLDRCWGLAANGHATARVKLCWQPANGNRPWRLSSRLAFTRCAEADPGDPLPGRAGLHGRAAVGRGCSGAAVAGSHRDAPMQLQEAYSQGASIRSPQDGMELVLVPAGEFIMGSPRDVRAGTEWMRCPSTPCIWTPTGSTRRK